MTTFQSLSIITAILLFFATVALFVAAVWGPDIRRTIHKPKLTLALLSSKGSVTTLNTDVPTTLRARYFHCTVSNTSRQHPFHNVRVLLKRIDLELAGEWKTKWEGRVPLRWRHEERAQRLRASATDQVIIPQPYEPKTVGAPWEADLFSLDSGGKFNLDPYIWPNTLLPALQEINRGPCSVRLTIVAISDEGDSKEAQCVIRWTKNWVDGADEMAKELTVDFRFA